jgi:isoaspartyl peptidase/L-asparaginase-like protein (Ntn-hydrolase superfamily)
MPGYARPPALSATGISVTPSGNLTSTNVQSAIVELDSDLTAVDNELVYSSASPVGSELGTLWINSVDNSAYVNSSSGWTLISGGGSGSSGGSKAFSLFISGM